MIDFARDVLGEPLDPWQQWCVIHAGELLPDGRPRFRKVLVLVARQNGKTHLLKVLALYWLFVEGVRMVLGMSTTLQYAKEAWSGAVELARESPELSGEVAAVLSGNNDTHMRTTNGGKYKIASATRRGGRSLSIDRLIIDELREHTSFEAWNAATHAQNARPHGQAFLITNQGDDTSVVLDSVRASALAFVESGEGDPRLGILEWSAPDGAAVDDVDALCAANPNAGTRVDLDALLAAARVAKEKGGREERHFRTEVLCQRVRILDAAIDFAAWTLSDHPDTLDAARDRLALCVDVSPDTRHATVVAAAVLPSGRTRVEVLAAWSGRDAVSEARKDLPGLVRMVRPQVVGWIPNGPAAVMAASLAARKGRTVWPPRGVRVEEIKAEVSAVCMGFAEQIGSHAVWHSGDPLLSSQVECAEKLWTGDTWRFERSPDAGDGHCDAVYAAAGAVHLARTLPDSLGRVRLVVATDDDE